MHHFPRTSCFCCQISWFLFLEQILTIWLALLAVATVYLYRSVRKKQSYWQDRGVKCKKPTFLFGSMSVVRDKSFAEKIVDVYNEFPGER
jgi:hypothetical protein